MLQVKYVDYYVTDVIMDLVDSKMTLCFFIEQQTTWRLMDTGIPNLLSDKQQQHGDTHYLAGLVIGVLSDPFTKFVLVRPELVYNWVQMLGKLIRMLFNPTNLDNYDDIMGYATLNKRIVEGDYDGISKPLESEPHDTND